MKTFKIMPENARNTCYLLIYKNIVKMEEYKM